MEERVYTIKFYDLDPSDVHIDRPLSNILINYRPQGFIADQIAPIVPVGKQSDRFFKMDQGDLLREVDDKRVPGREPNLISFDVSSDGYFANNYALGTYITREEWANADEVFKNRSIRSQFVMDILLMNYELRIARQVTSTSNVGSSTTTASAWGTDDANPYEDTQGDIASLEDLSGYRPNTIILGKLAWRKFRDSKEIRELLFPHGGGIPRPEQVKSLLEIDRVLIGGAYYNTGGKNLTKTLAKIWNDQVLYAYIAPRPSVEVPTYMYSFRWEVEGVPSLVAKAFPFDDKKGRQDIHVGYYQDEKIVDKYLGFLRTGVGSSQ